MVRPRREPQWGWPPIRGARGFVILKPWTRRGTDSFLGQETLPGAGEDFLTGTTPKPRT